MVINSSHFIENSWYCLSLQTQRQPKSGWRCTNFPGMLGLMNWSLSWQRKRRNQYAMNCVPTLYLLCLDHSDIMLVVSALHNWINIKKKFSLFFKIELVFIPHQLPQLYYHAIKCLVKWEILWNIFFSYPIASVCRL